MTKLFESSKPQDNVSKPQLKSENIAEQKRKRTNNVTKRLRNPGLRKNSNKKKKDANKDEIPEEDLPYYIDLSNKLVSVLYPANVENIDKAVETLGGLKAIATAASDEKRRLELRFRPKDVYCKPCCGDRDDSVGILVRIKVRRIIAAGPSCSSSEIQPIKETFQTTVIGATTITYKYKTLSDFQYLPMDFKKEPSYPEELCTIYNNLVPKELPDLNWLTEGEDPDANPLFLPPPIFSRFDSMFNIIGRKIIKDTGEAGFKTTTSEAEAEQETESESEDVAAGTKQSNKENANAETIEEKGENEKVAVKKNDAKENKKKEGETEEGETKEGETKEGETKEGETKEGETEEGETDEDESDDDEEEQDVEEDLQSLLRQMEQQALAGKEDESGKKTELVVGRFRKRRIGYGVASHFRDEIVPQKPQVTAVKMLRLKFLEGHQEIMTKV